MRTKSVASRSVRRARRYKRDPSVPSAKPAAVQVFLFRVETYLGCELFDLTGPVAVGRHPRAQLRLDGDTISRHHCRLVLEDGGLFVEDLGSANGTFVNRIRVKGRMAVEATDAIHIGSYTLKPRLLSSEPKGIIDPRQAEIETRVEAVLSVDVTGGGKEAPVDLAANLDQRLYQEAIRRKTGSESARAAEPASRRPTSKEPPPAPVLPELGPNETLEDSTLMAASELSLDAPEPRVLPPQSESVALDPAVEARLRDLDELIAALDAKQMGRRASQVPWRDPEQELPAKVIEGEDIGDEELNETCEFARDLASSLAVNGQMISERAKVISLDARRRSTAKDRRSFDPNEATTQEAEQRKRLTPVRPTSLKGERHEALLLTPTEMRASVRPVDPPAPIVQKPDPEDSFDSSNLDDVWSSRIEDHSEALLQFKMLAEKAGFNLEKKAPPPVPPASEQRKVATDEDETVAATGEIDIVQDDLHYDGVEVASRIGGRLADIAVLRRAGDQFILGHPTPQGTVAPAKAHVGLRLLRINEDRSVDLVFPRDVAGHLVRGAATVQFTELAEGRKYSCLRLEPRDVATVILGEGRSSISYHVRFLRRPKSLFRSLKGIGGA
jgi:hypothetical protein